MIDLEEGTLSVCVIGRAILFLLLVNLPDLSEDYAPHYHVLSEGLLREDLRDLPLALDVFGLSL